MSKIVDLGVEKDHIDSLTRATGLTAISELIWNALDADATIINIEITPNHLGGYESIEIIDNGHGLQYEKGQFLAPVLVAELIMGKKAEVDTNL